jgi:hypothetical protein
VPEAREITDDLPTQGVVLSVGGREDDPQDPVVRLRGKEAVLSPQNHS